MDRHESSQHSPSIFSHSHSKINLITNSGGNTLASRLDSVFANSSLTPYDIAIIGSFFNAKVFERLDRYNE